MIRLRHRELLIGRTLDAPIERVWDLITDTQAWSRWGPSISDVECEDRYVRLGTMGRIRTTLGFQVPFVITDYHPLRFWAWDVAGIRATGHGVEPLGPGRCRLIFTVPIWAAPYIIVCLLGLISIQRLLKS